MCVCVCVCGSSVYVVHSQQLARMDFIFRLSRAVITWGQSVNIIIILKH